MEPKNKILFGGAFDPVHLGHVEIVSKLVQAFSCAEIVVLPSFSPPAKKEPFLGFADRLDLAKCAFEKFSNVFVSDVEKDLGKPSYFYKVVNHFYNEVSTNLYMVIGMDQFLVLDTWYEFEKLVSKVNLIVFDRDKLFGHEKIRNKLNEFGLNIQKDLPIENQFMLSNGKSVTFFPLDNNISSTMIRKHAFKNADISSWLPSDVYRKIVENHFYILGNE